MRFELSFTAEAEFKDLPDTLQKAAHKQFSFLISNLRHPSLRAKKYDESIGLWQARISGSWRFYFFIKGDLYFISSIKKHPK